MKIFISADLEGTTGVSNWNETEKGMAVYYPIALQMSKEVSAVTEGLFLGGAEKVLIKDAHDSAANIDINILPEDSLLLKEWIGKPMSMMGGFSKEFHGVFFTGYHCGVHSDKNPLAHTMSRQYSKFKLNGKNVSEFHLNAYIAASQGVPVIGITGDKEVCREAKELNPNIFTVETIEGIGKAIISIHPKKALSLMKEVGKKAVEALKKNPEQFKIQLPKSFTLELTFIDHNKALRASYFPGVEKIDEKTVKIQGNSIEEVLTAYMFMS